MTLVQFLPRRWILHPILFSASPVLFLFVHNIEFLRWWTASYLYAAILAAVCLLWFALSRLLRDAAWAALISTFLLVLFFSYGHFGCLIMEWCLKKDVPYKNLYTALAWTGIFLAGLWSLARHRGNVEFRTVFLNTMSILLVIVTFFFGMTPATLSVEDHPMSLQIPQADPARAIRHPDIYYIILDAHGRDDVLRQLYGYDNSAFLDHLRRRGFFVAAKSRSNYASTRYSIASTLNFALLEEPIIPHHVAPGFPRFLAEMIYSNRLLLFLRQNGYTTVSDSIFDTAADLDIRRGLAVTPLAWGLLLESTPLPDLVGRFMVSSQRMYYRAVRHLTLRKFADLPSLVGNRRPLFAYVHIVSPHIPFVFGESGEPLDPPSAYNCFTLEEFQRKGGSLSEFRDRYRQQVTFIDQKAEELVDEILRRSPEPPVIILQGDHGPTLPTGEKGYVPAPDIVREKMSILNAYCLPDGGEKLLYESITPVNTFRVILNHYFGTQLALLPDRSFFHEPLRGGIRFVDVTDQLAENP